EASMCPLKMQRPQRACELERGDTVDPRFEADPEAYRGGEGAEKIRARRSQESLRTTPAGKPREARLHRPDNLRLEAKQDRCPARKKVLRFRNLTSRLLKELCSSQRAKMEAAQQDSGPRFSLCHPSRTGTS